jgi:hypothetical protein
MLGCDITYIRLKSSHEFVVFFFCGHVIGSNDHIDSVPMLKNLISHLWSLALRTCNELVLAQLSDFVQKRTMIRLDHQLRGKFLKLSQPILQGRPRAHHQMRTIEASLNEM